MAYQNWYILCRKRRRVGMEVVMGKISRRKQEGLYTQSMTNAPELLSRLQEVGRCMELPAPGAADEVRTACRALAHIRPLVQSRRIAFCRANYGKNLLDKSRWFR